MTDHQQAHPSAGPVQVLQLLLAHDCRGYAVPKEDVSELQSHQPGLTFFLPHFCERTVQAPKQDLSQSSTSFQNVLEEGREFRMSRKGTAAASGTQFVTDLCDTLQSSDFNVFTCNKTNWTEQMAVFQERPVFQIIQGDKKVKSS